MERPLRRAKMILVSPIIELIKDNFGPNCFVFAKLHIKVESSNLLHEFL